MTEFEDDGRTYKVVRNDEDQYSIWLAHKPLPAGWYAEGTEGSKPACLARIREVWTDMRPRSLRKAMEAEEQVAAQRA